MGFVLVETVGNLESNTAGNTDIAACAAFPHTQVLEPSEAMRKVMSCSIGKISFCQVHTYPEVGFKVFQGER